MSVGGKVSVRCFIEESDDSREPPSRQLLACKIYVPESPGQIRVKENPSVRAL